MDDGLFSVSDFVAVLNQTLEYAYPSVSIFGEISNFRISKGKWVYFDLKDEYASVKFFGTIYQLPSPLEDGMTLQVRGVPRLHQLYGFSVNIQFMQPVGEGSIKKAAALLEAKLAAEGLFDDSRKRSLVYPPKRIGLITSSESAAYADFIKVLDGRWSGVEVLLANVQVQGEPAIGQIIAALEYFNSQAEPPDVLVLTRGGGSADDLGIFSTEQVTRAVAASRIPTMVAIGHEIDVSLAELAADVRASTPSNAAELLVPDKRALRRDLAVLPEKLLQIVIRQVAQQQSNVQNSMRSAGDAMQTILSKKQFALQTSLRVLEAYDPHAILRRGYVIVKSQTKMIRRASDLKPGQDAELVFHDGNRHVKVKGA